jgi:hypothetical protein
MKGFPEESFPGRKTSGWIEKYSITPEAYFLGFLDPGR